MSDQTDCWWYQPATRRFVGWTFGLFGIAGSALILWLA